MFRITISAYRLTFFFRKWKKLRPDFDFYDHSPSESKQSHAVLTLVPHFRPEILNTTDRIQNSIGRFSFLVR